MLGEDGTLWLNLGDSYSGGGKGGNPGHSPHLKQRTNVGSLGVRGVIRRTAKPKDLVGIPWMVAFALRYDGWWLRAEAPWIKRVSMPESTRDRPTTTIEKVFLLTKSPRYFYDGEAVKMPASASTEPRYARGRSEDHKYADGGPGNQTIATSLQHMLKPDGGAARRSRRASDWFFESWQGMLTDGDDDPLAFILNPAPFSGGHFATFPPRLVRPCILAGCPVSGTVIDPFGGSGTTGMVALELGRSAILIELNPAYVELAKRRCAITPGLPLASDPIMEDS